MRTERHSWHGFTRKAHVWLGLLQNFQEYTMTGCLGLRTTYSVLEVEGSLRAPVHTRLHDDLATLLDHGVRRILLDLTRIPEIDAAGVGELVRAFNLTHAAGGVLRIANASERVGHFLRVAGILALLSDD